MADSVPKKAPPPATVETSLRSAQQQLTAKDQQIAELHAKLERLKQRFDALTEASDQGKQNEEQLRHALKDLEAANSHIHETHMQLLYAEKMAVLGALVAGIAHDIKTPVGAISSMQDTLVRAVEKLKSSLQEICPIAYKENRALRTAVAALEDANAVIESGSSRVLQIVQRLRNFARMDESTLLDADLHAGLEDALLLMHHELKNHVEVIKHYGELPRVRCNAGQINQVFLNVLVNAAQAIPNKGTIAITTTLNGDYVHVKIVDDGVGISEQNLAKIFEPGFTTKSIGVGTGLGLSICQKIVRDHKGCIDIASQKGKGTTVTLVLPTKLDALDSTCCGATGEPL